VVEPPRAQTEKVETELIDRVVVVPPPPVTPRKVKSLPGVGNWLKYQVPPEVVAPVFTSLKVTVLPPCRFWRSAIPVRSMEV
jgi:hypothetical protein